jgi:hypothetical protein
MSIMFGLDVYSCLTLATSMISLKVVANLQPRELSPHHTQLRGTFRVGMPVGQAVVGGFAAAAGAVVFFDGIVE